MIGIDTNVLVRFIVQDDKAQAKMASALILRHCSIENPGLISLIVLCEIVWVLSRAYGYSHEQVEATLRQILVTESFVVEQHELAWSAMLDYSKRLGDYADCLSARVNESNGTTTTVTFDKTASRNSRCTLLTTRNVADING